MIIRPYSSAEGGFYLALAVELGATVVTADRRWAHALQPGPFVPPADRRRVHRANWGVCPPATCSHRLCYRNVRMAGTIVTPPARETEPSIALRPVTPPAEKG